MKKAAFVFTALMFSTSLKAMNDGAKNSSQELVEARIQLNDLLFWLKPTTDITEICLILMRFPEIINQSCTEEPPLAIALHKNHAELVTWLLTNDADVAKEYCFYGNPANILYAIYNTKYRAQLLRHIHEKRPFPASVAQILEKWESLEQIYRRTTLDWLTHWCHETSEKPENLLNNLMIDAAQYQHDIKMIGKMLVAGAQINAHIGPCGYTVLEHTVTNWHDDNSDEKKEAIVRVVEFLLNHRANLSDSEALHLATAKDSTGQLIELLINKGAQVNRQEGSSMDTPLHSAASDLNSSATQILLAHNAKPNLKNRNGHKPINVALDWGFHYLGSKYYKGVHKANAVIQELLNAGAEVTDEEKSMIEQLQKAVTETDQ